ncbi:MAG: hypothetical protein RLY86_436 [Pseudomonadota bacterium]|jgi:putative transposase
MRYRRLTHPGQEYFFTVVTAGRRPVFADPERIALLRAAIRSVRRAHPFTITAAVVLPDHLHAIWRLPEEDGDHPMRWRLIKRAFSIRSGLAPAGPTPATARGYRGIWQHRHWEHMIRDDADRQRHIDYIHMNPVKHGYVRDAVDWPWSSIHSFIRRGDYARPDGAGGYVIPGFGDDTDHGE